MGKTILVLGGGIGGINAARELNRKIGNEDGINLARILVFEKEEKSVYAPSLTWLMVGKREPEQLHRDIRKTEVGGVEVINGEIETVDPGNISVTVNGEHYKGDYMVVSLGVEQTSERNLHKLGHNFYTLDGAKSFYEQLKDFKGGKIALVVSSLPFRSPVAPYEAAMLVESYIREKGLREQTEISLYTPEHEPMAFAGKEVSNQVRRLLESKDIRYLPEHELIATTDEKLAFSTHSGERKTTDFELLAYTPSHQCPSVIVKSGLCKKSGWIEADRQTLETSFPNVYAIGDITSIMLESGELLPKSGIIAKQQANVVAHNIAREIAGKNPNKTFDGQGEYILEVGDHSANKVRGDFYSADVDMKKSSVIRHWEKVLFEKSWFHKNF